MTYFNKILKIFDRHFSTGLGPSWVKFSVFVGKIFSKLVVNILSEISVKNVKLYTGIRALIISSVKFYHFLNFVSRDTLSKFFLC